MYIARKSVANWLADKKLLFFTIVMLHSGFGMLGLLGGVREYRVRIGTRNVCYIFDGWRLSRSFILV